MHGLAEYQHASGDRLTYTALRTMNIDGHQVAWVRYQNSPDSEREFSGAQIMCDCDLAVEYEQRDGYHIKRNLAGDPYRCPHRQAAMLLRAHETRQELNLESGGLFGRPEQLGELLIELVERVEDGQWVGQRDGSLYVQTAAQILDVSEAAVHRVAGQLMQQKRLAISASLLEPWSEQYEPRDDDDSALDDAQPPAGAPLVGVTNFHSETGTEGGYWAFQDQQHIKWIVPEHGYQGMPVKHNGQDAELVGAPEADGQVTIRLADGETVDCALSDLLIERWSYEGMHLLKTGDWLRVYNPDAPQTVLWQGYIRLRHYPLFTQDANGMWIHSDQRGVPRELWAVMFQRSHPAELVTAAGGEAAHSTGSSE